jgi:DNA-binding transcriptional regulator LsrR (DeoR family)
MERNRMELLAQVASLYYLTNYSQEQIATKLKYSRSMISRLLTEAREQHIVEVRIHHPLERCSDIEEELRNELGLTSVQVLARHSLTYDQMLRRLGELSARYVESLVVENMHIGVSWGTALREMIDMLNSRGYTNVNVIQIIGSLNTHDPEIDGPNLARNLAHVFGGHFSTLPAPLIVDSESTRDALMSDRSLLRTLTQADEIQMAVLGVGTVNPRRSSLLRAGYLTQQELDHMIQQGAVGDVCAIHFDINGNIMDIPLHRRRSGIAPETLLKIPIRLGIGGGEAKALSIVGACRAGFVNHLIADETAALRALQYIKGDD